MIAKHPSREQSFLVLNRRLSFERKHATIEEIRREIAHRKMKRERSGHRACEFVARKEKSSLSRSSGIIFLFYRSLEQKMCYTFLEIDRNSTENRRPFNAGERKKMCPSYLSSGGLLSTFVKTSMKTIISVEKKKEKKRNRRYFSRPRFLITSIILFLYFKLFSSTFDLWKFFVQVYKRL